MIGSLMAYVLLTSVLLAVAARALEEICRPLRLPVRFVWLSALLTVVGLASLAPFRTASETSATSTTPAPVFVQSVESATYEAMDLPAVIFPYAESDPILPDELSAGMLRAIERPLELAGGLPKGSAATALALGWLGLSGVLFLLGASTVLRYRVTRRRWPLRTVDGMEVRVSRGVGPAVLGLFRPEIVIPEWLMSRSAEERRLILLHEREHVRAGDSRVLAMAFFLATLLAWNPIVWLMLRRLRLAVEVDCDARVLRGGVRARDYGSMLIDVSGHASGGLSLGVPALASFPSTLERRLLAMTARSSRAVLLRGGAIAFLGCLAFLSACAVRIPGAPPVPRDGLGVEVPVVSLAGDSAVGSPFAVEVAEDSIVFAGEPGAVRPSPRALSGRRLAPLPDSLRPSRETDLAAVRERLSRVHALQEAEVAAMRDLIFPERLAAARAAAEAAAASDNIERIEEVMRAAGVAERTARAAAEVAIASAELERLHEAIRATGVAERAARISEERATVPEEVERMQEMLRTAQRPQAGAELRIQQRRGWMPDSIPEAEELRELLRRLNEMGQVEADAVRRIVEPANPDGAVRIRVPDARSESAPRAPSRAAPESRAVRPPEASIRAVAPPAASPPITAVAPPIRAVAPPIRAVAPPLGAISPRFQGIFLIDGEVTASLPDDLLGPDGQIARIEVFKGEAAMQIIDHPLARFGVIRITTNPADAAR